MSVDIHWDRVNTEYAHRRTHVPEDRKPERDGDFLIFVAAQTTAPNGAEIPAENAFPLAILLMAGLIIALSIHACRMFRTPRRANDDVIVVIRPTNEDTLPRPFAPQAHDGGLTVTHHKS